MFERMKNKEEVPSTQDIRETLGNAQELLDGLEAFLSGAYDLTRALKYPFGREYGWGYKYGHKTKHLCYAFFERGAFTVTLQIGDKDVTAMERKISRLSIAAQDCWKNRYPCGKTGGWIHYRITDGAALADAIEFIQVKHPPKN
jgi:hypothetical protein